MPRFDVVIESFVPGTLERMGLGWDVLQSWHPELILVRISGWGQPVRQPAAGLWHAGRSRQRLCGDERRDRAARQSCRAFPLADMTSALYAVNAVMFALYHRDVHGGAGQVVDVSLFESLFSLLGPLAAEYATLGRCASAMAAVRKLRPARLLPDQRWPMDRRQRIDAEDGGAIPSEPMASAICSRIRGCNKRGARAACRAAGRRDRRGDSVADARRELPHHRGARADGARCRPSPTSNAMRTGRRASCSCDVPRRRGQPFACTTWCRACPRRRARSGGLAERWANTIVTSSVTNSA